MAISKRIGKQCRERCLNVLDPGVKIGGWSDHEQLQIFYLLIENSTSWSKISKYFKERTENPIKNYFYSTIRRIQGIEILTYFKLMAANECLPLIPNIDSLEKEYQLDRLNLLGKQICKWLYSIDDAKLTILGLTNYILNLIISEKKSSSNKGSKSLESQLERLMTKKVVKDQSAMGLNFCVLQVRFLNQ